MCPTSRLTLLACLISACLHAGQFDHEPLIKHELQCCGGSLRSTSPSPAACPRQPRGKASGFSAGKCNTCNILGLRRTDRRRRRALRGADARSPRTCDLLSTSHVGISRRCLWGAGAPCLHAWRCLGVAHSMRFGRHGDTIWRSS